MNIPALPQISFATVGPPVGARFPDVRLPDQHGRAVDLHATRGERRGLVVFYRSARWWPYCKTQLVELQQHLAGFEQAGMALFAISYDPVAVLRAFADKRGITYPLLSDEGSQTIRALGLLNRHVEEQSRFYGVTPRAEHQGVPYPGSFLLDERGIVVAKQFEQGYRHRPIAALLLDEVIGEPGTPPLDRVHARGQGLQVAAWLDAPVYRPYQMLRLHVAFQVEQGFHAYAAPAPDGCIPLTVELLPVAGLSVQPLAAPPPQPFRVEGLDGECLGYAGAFRATLPFSIDAKAGEITLDVRVRYQACGDAACFPPDELSLLLPLREQDLIRDWARTDQLNRAAAGLL